MIAQQQEETLHLDFKTVGKEDLSVRDDRRNLARSVSGFANSDGGLIIWGVVARKRADGADCATAAQPLQNAKLFVSRLNDLTGDAVSPLVDGVEHRILTSRTGGFAATLVPASDRGPHMALLGEHQYYKRSGSSFYPMEHFDIADMFGRRASPSLKLVAKVLSGGSSGTGNGGIEFNGKIVLRLENRGRGSARAPYLEFSLSAGRRLDQFGIDGNGREGLPRVVGAGGAHPHRFGSSGEYLIHPHSGLDVAAIDVKVVRERDGTVRPSSAVVIRHAIAAEGMPLTDGELSVSSSEIENCLIPA